MYTYIEIQKTSLNNIHLPHDLALWLTLSGSNYPCLEQIYMLPKMFELFEVRLYTLKEKTLLSLGPKSSLSEFIPFQQKGISVPENKQEVTKIVSLLKMAENLPSDSSSLKKELNHIVLTCFHLRRRRNEGKVTRKKNVLV